MSNKSIFFSLLFFIAADVSPVPVVAQKLGFDGLRTYIVHVQQDPASSPFSTLEDREKWYKSFLPTVTAGVGESRLIHSYSSVVSGFAARLTDEELAEMKTKDGFVHAYPDRIYPLLTTHSHAFLGLSQTSGLWTLSSYGSGVVIGVLDTGVSPSHPSFRDDGMPPPPAKWKGVCQFNVSDCNNKLIGARDLVQGLTAMQGSSPSGVEPQSPWDYQGHGTHTASTAAGMFVNNANVDGQANGTAAGMAPSAHVAVYKVCGNGGCASSDVLAGMDKAVEDGVDVLSLSLGGASLPFYSDTIAIGAFGAVEKGVFVSCAGGNSGPSYASLANEAPWILTVGASTMDRSLRTTVQLGNKATFNGQSAYQPGGVASTPRPLVYPGSIVGGNALFCVDGSLNGIDVRGKVVLCDDGVEEWASKGAVVKSAGGAAMIIANQRVQGFTTFAHAHVLPTSHVSYSDGLTIKTYINSSQAPTASIDFKGTLTKTTPAPAVAYFSSRGPNQADPNILKPDIIGPGVNILAAWPFPVGSPGEETNFNLDSGTSMATPHLSGIAALLKSAHPDWSPAAIKSAIMTTADLLANDNNPIPDQDLNRGDLFAIGAGHVNPARANSPGLIYDTDPKSYIAYLCGLQYNDKQVGAVVRHLIQCAGVRSISGLELNYPSFMVSLSAANNYTVTVLRTVTNVGASSSAYTVQVTGPTGVMVTVRPRQLSFTKAKEEAQFSITFTSTAGSSGSDGTVNYFEGYLTWVSSDQRTTVTSPIMVGIQ